jgi:excisionase family DNA binding protein
MSPTVSQSRLLASASTRLQRGLPLTIIETAAVLRIHPRTLLRWRNTGQLKVLRPGGKRLLVSHREVQRLMDPARGELP